jgi:hypothetical protein
MRPHRFEALADEDQRTGFLLDSRPDEPTEGEVLLGVFVVLYQSEYDTLFDPSKLLVSVRPKAYRSDELQEAFVPTVKAKAEVWAWVITGLDKEGAIVR